MVPPASAGWLGVRSFISVGAGGVALSGLGSEAGTAFGGWSAWGFWVLVLGVGFDEDFDLAWAEAGSRTTPLESTGRRSSSTAAVVGFCCHSSMAPSAVGAA